jgi:hypothetical protein
MNHNDRYHRMIEQMEPGLKRSVLRVISQRRGRENAINRENLAKAMESAGFGKGLTLSTFDRKIRNTITDLRKEGALICSSSGEAGYFMARSQEEYDTFAATEYRSKIKDMAATLQAMDQAAEQLFGKRNPSGQKPLF